MFSSPVGAALVDSPLTMGMFAIWTQNLAGNGHDSDVGQRSTRSTQRGVLIGGFPFLGCAPTLPGDELARDQGGMSMATIQQSIISRVQPGRFDDFLSLNGEAVKLHERLGVPGARVFLAGAAGESAGTVIFATEHPSMAAYAAYGEAVAADGEMQALLARLRSKDSPVVIEQQTLATEIPLGRTPNPTRGTVVEVHASRATPGRLEDVMAMGRRVCDFVESNGATNARSFH